MIKTTIKTVALLAVLSVSAVGCQKETITVERQTGVELRDTVYTVRYSINGVMYAETLIGEQAWAEFLQRMLALAEEGYQVTMSRNAESIQYGMAKDVVTFKTKSKEAAYAWVEEKTGEGYEVTVTYNPQTGEYICVGVK